MSVEPVREPWPLDRPLDFDRGIECWFHIECAVCGETSGLEDAEQGARASGWHDVRQNDNSDGAWICGNWWEERTRKCTASESIAIPRQGLDGSTAWG